MIYYYIILQNHYKNKIDNEKILELNTFNLTSKKQDLIIDMCKSVNADKFIFAPNENFFSLE